MSEIYPPSPEGGAGRDVEGAPRPPAAEARNADQASLLLLVLVLVIAAVITAFFVILPSLRPPHNMEAQPYHKPYTPSDVFLDGMSERPLVSGVVPRPASQSPGVPYVFVRTAGPANYPDVARTGRIPFPITRQVLRHGQEQYDIYCAVCHGSLGDGDGMIVRRGFYPPPSYHIDRLRNAPDSHFYDVITNGYGTMFSYSERVAPEDRWAITAYIRALQISVEQSPDLSKRFNKETGVRP